MHCFRRQRNSPRASSLRLNDVGDREASRWNEGAVTTPEGWRQAYAKFVEGGWMGLSGPVEAGGQGMPNCLSAAMMEDFNAANVAFALCPMLGLGAVEAIEAHGSEELKRDYLSRIVSGEWTATMNLTEPQAGSDVGALKSKAVPAGDGSWKISGTKIFITYGEHDLTDNIIHMVLARTPGAPGGPREFRCSSFPKCFRTDSRTTSAAFRSSIRWASTPRRPVSWPMAKMAERRAG